jgi:hypothetical protein
MTISHIKTLWLRRVVLVPAYIVILPVAFVIGAGYGALEYVADVHRAALRAWSGQ